VFTLSLTSQSNIVEYFIGQLKVILQDNDKGHTNTDNLELDRPHIHSTWMHYRQI